MTTLIEFDVRMLTVYEPVGEILKNLKLSAFIEVTFKEDARIPVESIYRDNQKIYVNANLIYSIAAIKIEEDEAT